LRCGRCGNENDAATRFCGMCGAALVAEERAAGQAATSSPARARMEPVITGPSFLGLNTPAPGTERAGMQDRNPEGHRDGGRDQLRPSSSVDYLLEDEEEPRGWGKWILMVVALALAVGFGYLRWKQGGFEWLNGGDKKPAAATTQTPDGGQSGADSGAAAGTSANAGGAAPQAGAGAAAAPAASPAESGAPQTTASQTSLQTSLQGTPTQSAPTENASAPATASKSADQPSPSQSDAGDSSGAAAGAQPASSDSDESPAVTAPRAVARKPAAAKPSAAKPPAAKPAASKSVDSVTEAERYIYGRGVAQDCDRGLRLLKPAAEQSNVKAMISLGALYSTGSCTPRDLPTAYRWFALALHREPDNQALQNDLQKLWSQMTQPERQLAIKLSQ
jgi:hypothetical protein